MSPRGQGPVRGALPGSIVVTAPTGRFERSVRPGAVGSPDQAQEAMGLWMAWMEKAGPALVDPGSPLGEATEVPSVAGQSGRHVGGCSILQGESVEDIKKLLDGHPHYHSPDATIEVHKFLAMPGTS